MGYSLRLSHLRVVVSEMSLLDLYNGQGKRGGRRCVWRKLGSEYHGFVLLAHSCTRHRTDITRPFVKKQIEATRRRSMDQLSFQKSKVKSPTDLHTIPQPFVIDTALSVLQKLYSRTVLQPGNSLCL